MRRSEVLKTRVRRPEVGKTREDASEAARDVGTRRRHDGALMCPDRLRGLHADGRVRQVLQASCYAFGLHVVGIDIKAADAHVWQHEVAVHVETAATPPNVDEAKTAPPQTEARDAVRAAEFQTKN